MRPSCGCSRAPASRAAEAFALSVLFVALGVVGNLPGALLYLTGGLHEPSRAAALPDRSETAAAVTHDGIRTKVRVPTNQSRSPIFLPSALLLG